MKTPPNWLTRPCPNLIKSTKNHSFITFNEVQKITVLLGLLLQVQFDGRTIDMENSFAINISKLIIF
jgi:hypothetical protein